jgi:Asp-tRNA(Asn)/Glu-tRNA(Gln) amidotransferase A subunit family amidase
MRFPAQAQRARMVAMTMLHEATRHVDVWIAPGNAATPPVAGTPRGAGNAGPAGRHSNMCQHACYPALSVPNGFRENGTATATTFFARPFGESELLAVAKAYQDATGHHLKHPPLAV